MEYFTLLNAARVLLASLHLLDARVATLDGTSAEGRLTEMSSESVVLESDDGTQSVSTDQLLKIDFDHTVVPASSPMEAVLQDGSRLATTQLTATADQAQCDSAVFGSVDLPRKVVRALRLQDENPEWETQWNAFLERTNDRDLLIVVKRDGTGLDFLSGVVSSVTTEAVLFLLDGDEIPVPRSRVFGVIFQQSTEESGLQGAIRVQLTNGRALKARSVTLSQGQLNVMSSWGSSVKLPAELVATVDFSSSLLHYLSDLEPLSEQYFGLDPAGQEWGDLFENDRGTRTGFSSPWRMSRDGFPNSGRPPLTLRKTSYAKGLCVFPHAVIEYALDGQYRRLTAMVGVDDEVAFNQRPGLPPTQVELVVEADGREVFRKLITAPDDPFPLDLDVQNINTLTVTVDFGDGSSTCDYLDLADAKLILDSTKN